MVTAARVREAVDRMVAEKGEKLNGVYRLTITTGELIEVFGLKTSIPHHRHFMGVIQMHYPGTTAEPLGRGDGAQGFRLNIRIRSR